MERFCIFRVSESAWQVGMHIRDANGRFGADSLNFSRGVRVCPIQLMSVRSQRKFRWYHGNLFVLSSLLRMFFVKGVFVMTRELPKVYEPQQVENKIYKMWEENGHFKPNKPHDAKPFTIVMPPPNVTGQLHMGHAMDATLQDTLIRLKRIRVSCRVASIA